MKRVGFSLLLLGNVEMNEKLCKKRRRKECTLAYVEVVFNGYSFLICSFQSGK